MLQACVCVCARKCLPHVATTAVLTPLCNRCAHFILQNTCLRGSCTAFSPFLLCSTPLLFRIAQQQFYLYFHLLLRRLATMVLNAFNTSACKHTHTTACTLLEHLVIVVVAVVLFSFFLCASMSILWFNSTLLPVQFERIKLACCQSFDAWTRSTVKSTKRVQITLKSCKKRNLQQYFARSEHIYASFVGYQSANYRLGGCGMIPFQSFIEIDGDDMTWSAFMSQ